MTSSIPEFSAFSELVSSSQVRQNRRDFLRVSAIATAAATMPLKSVVAAQSTPSDSPTSGTADVTLNLPFNPFGQEVTTDPHRTVNWGPFWVLMPYAWSGLLRFDENGAVESDLAESVSPNDDGSVWTATLKEGVAFADGTAITAEHVLQSWLRALDSTRLTPMSRFFEPIVGAAEMASGENVVLGATVKDERTIEISLVTPLAHFPSFLATFGFAVVHPDIDSAETPMDIGQACSGPWSISGVTDTEIRMVQNPRHWSEPSADVGELVWMIAPGGATDQTILDWFGADQIAVADVPPSLIETVLADEAMASMVRRPETQAATMVLALDFHQEPFNDVRVRRAVAAAVDRESWATDIELGAYVAANSFTPPVLASIANYEAPMDAFDDDAAALIEDSGFNPAESEDEIIFFQPATDSAEAIERTAQLIAAIMDATTLEITHDTMLTSEQITAVRQDAGGLQMAMMQWQLDSAQPSLLGIMSQSSPYNAGWINWEPELDDSGDYTPGADAATFDELVTTAQMTLDEAERNSAYAEAEALLLKNAVLIPLGFWSPAFVQKPWLSGTRQGPWSGSSPVRIDAEVIVDRDAMSGTPATN